MGTVIVLAAGTTVAFTRHRSAADPAPKETTSATTTKVERRDISTTRSLDGNIGFGAVRPLSGHREGTVTWLPEPGATIKRGEQLFRVDDQPVVLLYGNLPLFRAIEGRNLVGRDVRVIANNLAELGYSIGYQPAVGESVVPADGTKAVQVQKGEGVLTTALVDALKRWQRDIGMPVTGTIRVGDVEVQSGAVRVDSIAVQPGSPAQAPLMSVTSTLKLVTVSAELPVVAGIAKGDSAEIVLPDERAVPAKVISVGRNLVPAEGAEAPTVSVAVAVNDAKSIAALDSAAVKVRFVGRTAKGVLAVPIEALVALVEGGYAVHGPTGLVSVRTGMFAGGWVEIEGAGLTEGTDVVISS
ncbi:efflux RND transporter periplasmic adaptor subunit [Micromonospora sp. LOL_024]|uniref:efflux RND transporter periplasmic adaptor subunit n=1 Tax=Micromonospora sp. LOL_024 TaxID=3345412 RepID=UPI003A8493AA